MLHVIYGPDRALARESLRKLLRDLDPNGDNTSYYEAPSDQSSSVAIAIATPTFFSTTRIVVAESFLSLLKQSAGGKRTTKTRISGAAGEIENLIEVALVQGTLIFFEPELAALPAAAKALIPESASVTGNAPPRGTDLIEFAVSAAQERGSSIDQESTRYLLSRLFPGHWNQVASNPAFDRPPDIGVLRTEIDKLATAAGSDGIDTALIDKLTPAVSSDRMFPLLDAIVSGNSSGALREFHATPPTAEEHLRLIAMIGQQVEFAAAAAAPGRPGDPLQAGKSLGMSNPNRMKAILQAAGSPAASRRLLDTALDADRRFKTGVDTTPVDSIYRIISSSVTTSERKRGK